MTIADKLVAATAGSGAAEITVENIFSLDLYEGKSPLAPQVRTNGINYVDNDAMMIFKNRTSGNPWRVLNTIAGNSEVLTLQSDTAGAVAAVSETNGVTAFSENGYTVGSDASYNSSTTTDQYYSTTFARHTDFFDLDRVSHTTGSTTVISFQNISVIGMVTVKQVDGAGDWFTWHRSLSAGNNVKFNQSHGEILSDSVSVSGSDVTIGSGVATGTYIVYVWAHNEDADAGFIQCGSYIGNGSSSNGVDIDLGWEPQYIIIKRVDSSGTWYTLDSMRGCSAKFSVGGSYSGDMVLNMLGTAPENASDTNNYMSFRPFGFTAYATSYINTSGGKYVYIAVRRPNKTPKTGEEVFCMSFGRSGEPTGYGSTFPVDLAIRREGVLVDPQPSFFYTRGANYSQLRFDSVGAELNSNINFSMDYTDGWYASATAVASMSWMFRRLPYFSEYVYYFGNGLSSQTIKHNLKVAPELILFKRRDSSLAGVVTGSVLGTDNYLELMSSAGSNAVAVDSTMTGSLPADENNFYVGTNTRTNQGSGYYMALMFASLAGVSKVGSYVGNGSNQVIGCGFSTGARFVLIKRTDAVGDWYFWDTFRGIVAGDESHFSLNNNSTPATDDSIDPDATGFIVNQNTATNINVNTANYIFLAIA